MNLKTFARLTRIEHGFMYALAVVIGEILVLGGLPPFAPLVLGMAAALFIEAGSFALNDCFDFNADRLNRRYDRPLVSGDATQSQALFISAAAFAVGNAGAYLLTRANFYIAVSLSALAFLYNWKLKDLPMVGNAYIAFTMAIPPIFGAYAVGAIPNDAIWIFSLIAFTVGLAREFVKTVADVEGDVRARRSMTLPALIGKKPVLFSAGLLYISAVALSALPYFGAQAYLNDPAYLAPVALADAIFLYLAFLSFTQTKRRSFDIARKYSLIALALGLAGFLAGALL